jgi:hypothetical protein
MAAENCLWGAPRIHGELLKLGVAVSERTVSRYLRGRPTTRSQTWRTFLANHVGGQTFISPPVIFAHAHDQDIIVDASDSSLCPAPSIDSSYAAVHGSSVDRERSLPPFFGLGSGQNQLQDHTGARNSSGRGPPLHLPLQSPRGSRPDVLSCAPKTGVRAVARAHVVNCNDAPQFRCAIKA